VHSALNESGQPLDIVHQDISPANILFGRDGTIKLADFGIATSNFALRPSLSTSLKGKIGYMSPEQLLGGHVDRRADLFALGVVLAELLIGVPLFQGKDASEISLQAYDANLDELEASAVSLPPDVMSILRTTLAVTPAARFQSAGEVLSRLARAGKTLGAAFGRTPFLTWLIERGLIERRSHARDWKSPRVPRSELLCRIHRARTGLAQRRAA
jgi:eukaryotic-like serine/threonine-protein kinase